MKRRPGNLRDDGGEVARPCLICLSWLWRKQMVPKMSPWYTGTKTSNCVAPATRAHAHAHAYARTHTHSHSRANINRHTHKKKKKTPHTNTHTHTPKKHHTHTHKDTRNIHPHTKYRKPKHPPLCMWEMGSSQRFIPSGPAPMFRKDRPFFSSKFAKASAYSEGCDLRFEGSNAKATPRATPGGPWTPTLALDWGPLSRALQKASKSKPGPWTLSFTLSQPCLT